MYHQRPAFTPEQREARHKDLFRCIIICGILLTLLAGAQALLTGCQPKAWAPKQNQKPRTVGSLGIRDRETPTARYSPLVWAEDTTSSH